MSNVFRSEMLEHSETGGEWFKEFLRLCSDNKTLQENILNAITSRQGETVDSVVKNYREMVGLDLIKNAGEKPRATFEELYKNAPKTIELKNKIENFAGQLSTWNLKHDTFPNVPVWVRETMHDFPYGQKEVFKYLKDVAQKRSEEYWGTSIEFRIQPDYKQILGILSDLAGDEASSSRVSSAKYLSIRQASNLGPIAPMKLKKVENPDDFVQRHGKENTIVQIKYDGFKVQAIRDKAGVVKLYTRRSEDFTSNLPDLVSQLTGTIPKGSFFLGELVWEKDGIQSLSDIQTIVGSSPERAKIKLKEKEGKPIFYVYDLLWENEKDLTKLSYEERYNKLKKLVGKDKENIKLVPSYSYDEKDEIIKAALKVNAEGIILKPKKSVYKYGKKGESEPMGEWAKFKPGEKAREADVLVKDYTIGDGGKLIMPAYQYEGTELIEVGKVSGLSKENEAKVKKLLDAGKKVVIEVGYQERLPSKKFRSMSFKRLRPDKPAKEVKYSKVNSMLSIRFGSSNILSNPQIIRYIDGFCQNSGGTKSTHSIINSLREKFGNELVSFSNEALVNYINERKQHFKEYHGNNDVELEVGKADDHFDDFQADYTSRK